MTILSTDIKLMASERLTDNDDGGGQMSAVEIEDGVVNNLFPDISRLDRTYGRVNLRKLYLAVRTANQDVYYGSHAIVTDPPDDPRVSTLIFSTESYTDERVDAKNRIESYVVPGPKTRYTVYGTQLQGQRTLLLFADVDADLPKIGEAYVLSDEQGENDDGTPNVMKYQYVRITENDSIVQEFEDSQGKYEKRIITLGISEALRETYTGVESPDRVHKENKTTTKFRTTSVADASRYYSIVPLQEPLSAGDVQVRCSTIYGQLVPSSTAESAAADIAAGELGTNLVASGPAYQVDPGNGWSSGYFGRPIVPGSLSITGTNWSDDSAGQIRDAGGVLRGEVEYSTGYVELLSNTNGNILAQPATSVMEPTMTAAKPISLANRGYNYIQTLRPIPQPGTLVVDYLAEGEWYRMRDDGSGNLSDEYGGAGNINFVTGTVVVTTGGLPDVDSNVIFSWATPSHYEERTADPQIQLPTLMTQVSAKEFLPGSVELTWEAGGQTMTATDDGVGNLTGDATGRLIYGTGQIGFRPALVPASGATLTINYDRGVQQTDIFTSSEITEMGDSMVMTLPGPIRPGTVRLTFTLAWDKLRERERVALDDGSIGSTFEESSGTADIEWIDNGDGTLSPQRVGRDGQTFVDGVGLGAINYTTGELTVAHSFSWDSAENDSTIDYSLNSAVTAYYQEDSVIPDAMTESSTLPDVTLDLLPTIARYIVPGSLEFVWGNKTYIDREGTLYTDWDRQTGAATPAGSINYATGIVSLYGYAGGHGNSVDIKTLVARYEQSPSVESVYFRTPGAPLRPASLYLRAVEMDGSLISATADLSGEIDTPEMEGFINYQTGIVDVRFRKFVNAPDVPPALLNNPSWVAENEQIDGTYRMAVFVDASSIKYNAVFYSQMPLNSDILGLDPVRLPMNGKVPVIRAGDVVVIHSTQTEALPNPLSAGQTINLSRDQLARVELIDNAGETVDAALYTVDRQAGTITMADPLDLSAYTQPLQAKHRIEDMSLVNEAQINGQITLVGGVSRAYDPADTWISSALIFGDLGSRVHHLFSQATWTSEWADERIGNPTTAQYNDRLYPIQVDNKNSIRERWAIIFTDSYTFNIVGEVSGVIGTGSTSSDCAPLNPVTGEPYFTLFAPGWGSGWATNNVLRFNTDAAHAPVWVARTTVSGAATHDDDSFKIEARGDSD